MHKRGECVYMAHGPARGQPATIPGPGWHSGQPGVGVPRDGAVGEHSALHHPHPLSRPARLIGREPSTNLKNKKYLFFYTPIASPPLRSSSHCRTCSFLEQALSARTGRSPNGRSETGQRPGSECIDVHAIGCIAALHVPSLAPDLCRWCACFWLAPCRACCGAWCGGHDGEGVSEGHFPCSERHFLQGSCGLQFAEEKRVADARFQRLIASASRRLAAVSADAPHLLPQLSR